MQIKFLLGVMVALLPKASAQTVLEGVVKAHHEKVSHRIMGIQAQKIIKEWRESILFARTAGQYKIDVAVAVRGSIMQYKSLPDKKIHYVLGVKAKCAKAFGVHGENNTIAGIMNYSSKARGLLAPDVLAARAEIQAFFDDPKAVCKDPHKGFDIYAVGKLAGDEELAVWSADETDNIRH